MRTHPLPRKRRGGWYAALFIAFSLASCTRVEEPRPQVSNAPRTATHDGAPSGQAGKRGDAEPAAMQGRCWVPTPAEASAPARPAAECPTDPGPVPVLPQGSVRFIDAPDKPRVLVELAREHEHRSRGLMYRTHMPEERGMLFSWSEEQVQSFWMHNTCIPLDMLFIATDQTILGILEQVPTLNERSRTIPCAVSHVLELNAGWTRQHGVKAGQRVQIQD
ncbi:MAG TPA: DUF192 domain-containing protein [Polyangiaceae bacterium]|nr:DUF192 domain-containing protein [Polyangiaceae bacterium]